MDGYRHAVVLKLFDEGRWMPEGPGRPVRTYSPEELDEFASFSFALPLPDVRQVLTHCWRAIQAPWRQAQRRADPQLLEPTVQA